MQLYLAKSADTAFIETPKYAVAKLLSYHLGELLDKNKIHEELAFTNPEAGEETYKLLDDMISACSATTFRHADAYDVSVFSEKYNLRGKIDRFFEDGFSIIKGGVAPNRGVYAADRLQAFCYTVCLKEMYGKEFIPYIEYLGSGTIRRIEIAADDRRAFIQILKETEAILRGEIPRSIHGKFCAACRFNESCKNSAPKSLYDRLKKQK